MAFHDSLDEDRDTGKWERAFQEGVHGDLIGRIQDGRHRLSDLDGPVSQFQAGESLGIGV
jgi:hypothetical protein